MTRSTLITRTVFLFMGFAVLATACTNEPREGYYDRDHHRYYHEHQWRDCVDRDEHCHD